MTCIVGVAQDGVVCIGGDCAGSAGSSITHRSDEKVFRNGPYLLGFTHSFRMGQLLRYTLKPPKPPENDKNLYCFMVNDFIKEVRECFKEGGYTTISNSVESGGTFLVGINGRLFRIDSDFQVGEAKNNYMAVGSGGRVSEGALFATAGKAVRSRVKLALEAAAKHDTFVAAPFTIKQIG